MVLRQLWCRVLVAMVSLGAVGNTDVVAARPGDDLKDLKDLTQHPVMVQQVTPVYPYDLRKDGIEGVATIAFIITKKGKVKNAYIVRADHPDFGRAALSAVKKCRFTPGKIDGQAVNTQLQIPITFSIPEKAATNPEQQKGKVVRPVPLELVDPDYPNTMYRVGMRAHVVVQCKVNEEGKVEEPFVVKTNHPGFRQAALEAARKSTYLPGRIDGKATTMSVVMHMEFTPGSARKSDIWGVKRPREFPDEIPEALHWDTPPILVNYYPPVYPREAYMKKVKKRVKLGFLVDPSGQVTVVKPLSEAPAELIGAATAAVRSFEFLPARKNGQPCGAMLKMDFNFVRTVRGDAPVTQEMIRMAKVLTKTPEAIFSLKELDEMPGALYRKLPVTPLGEDGLEVYGEVKLEFIVSRHGEVLFPRALAATNPALEYAAIQAVDSWQFSIPRKDGNPVDVRAVVPIVFKPVE